MTMRNLYDFGGPVPDKPENWSGMTWQEKREVRFERWLNPPDVKFVSPEAEKLSL